MSRLLFLRIGAEKVEAEVRQRCQPIWRGSAQHGGPGDLAATIAQLAGAGAPLSKRPVVRVEFQAPPVQLRTLSGLPPVRAAALADLVAVQRGRFFRQNGKPLVTTARWLPGKKGQPPLARAAAIEEHWTEAVLHACRAAGLEVEAIGPAGAEEGLDLMPPAERVARRRRWHATLRRWSTFTAAAWILLGILAVVRFSREERRVSSTLEALRKPALALTAAKDALRAGSETLGALGSAERERVALLRVLAAVVSALPDSSHLTALEMDLAGSGSMSGLARRTGEVLERLDDRQAVVAPRLVGAPAATLAPASEWQPFVLEFGGRKP